MTVSELEVSAHSAHELTRTYDNRTPGCDGEAKANSGRFAYCIPCQVRRGTAYPDGTLIRGPIPNAPGTRSGRKRKTPAKVSSQDFLAVSPVPASHNGKVGAYEAKAAALVAAARELDAALEAYKAAKPALEQAKERWREALQGFNGKPATSDDVSEIPPEPAPQFAGLA